MQWNGLPNEKIECTLEINVLKCETLKYIKYLSFTIIWLYGDKKYIIRY